MSDDIRCQEPSSKHALPCVQHPATMTILSTEGRYDIIKTWEHYHISLMMDSC